MQDFDYREFEIIVPYSCSTNNTLEITKKYAGKIAISSPRGHGSGRNLGAAASRERKITYKALR